MKYKITMGLTLALMATGCMVRTTTARKVTGQVVDLRGKPLPGATVRIESPAFPEPKDVVAGPDGRFEYRGRAPWELYSAGAAVETPVTVTASDNGRKAPPKLVGGGAAQRRLFGFGGMRSTDVGVLVIADPFR